MDGYISHIKDRNETARLTGIYNAVVQMMESADSEGLYKAAASKFRDISGFKDADELAQECLEKAEVCRKDEIYNNGCRYLGDNTIVAMNAAIQYFKSISGWKDADEKVYACQRKAAEIRAKEEADRLEAKRQAELRKIAAEKRVKKLKKIAIIATPIVCVCIVFVIVLTTVIIPKQEYSKKYSEAMEMIESGNYEAGYAILEELGENETIQSNKYDRAIKLMDSGDYDSAYELLSQIGKNDMIESSRYDRAIKSIDSGDYQAACALLAGLTYKDSAEKLQSIRPLLLAKAIPGDMVSFGKYEQDYDTSNGKEDIEWLVLDKKDDAVLIISKHVLEDKSFGRNDDTWETCSLRKWLNADFINDAFSTAEQSKIQSTQVAADKKRLL